MSRRLFAFIALFAFVQVSFAAWSGSAKIPKVVKSDGQDYYEITTPEEFVGFLDSIVPANSGKENLKAYLKNDIVFGADTSKLSSKKWVRKPSYSYFSGEFDGRGHTVYGLNAEKAMFYMVGSAVGSVSNLNVANSSFGSDTVGYAATISEYLQSVIRNVNVYNTKVHGMFYAGSITAFMNESADSFIAYILNCNVVGGSVSAGSYVGGIVGFALGRVIGCTNSAKVYFVNPDWKYLDFSRAVYVGGITGYSESWVGAAVSSCVNRGNVEMKTNYRESYVGGIAGYSLGALENLQNYGKISTKVSLAANDTNSEWKIFSEVGGIVGYHDLHKKQSSETRDLLNDGAIVAIVETDLEKARLSVGGIAGESFRVSVANALNRGSIEAYGNNKLLELYAGGIIGYSNKMYAGVEGYVKLKNRGNITAEGTYWVYAGGILGYENRPANDGKPGISLSFNYGNVTGTVADDASESEILAVGGIAGYANVVISDVYNHGKLNAKGKLAYGASYVGGIVGEISYWDGYVKNSYSAAPSMKGDTLGGVIAYALDGGYPQNSYFDKSLVSANSVGRNYFEDKLYPECKKSTADLKNDKMVTLLNTENGAVADRHLWVRRGGYPVLSFDSLYKNDSVFFNVGEFEIPQSKIVDDTVVYVISTAAELRTFLEMGRALGAKVFKVELANDIVMGRDSLHVMQRAIAIDTNYLDITMNFDGKGHTIYGLNMTRAMFRRLDTASVVQNLTIANSRFVNENGLSAAGVVIENAGCVYNVTIRNSVVRGGDAAGGLVAYNRWDGLRYAIKSKNENTAVYSDSLAGGIVGEATGGVVSECFNSGRVSGKIVGGLVGYMDMTYDGSTGIISKSSNQGMVLASGNDSVYAGGVAGRVRWTTLSADLNSGLVEGSAASGMLMVGGIAGYIDSSMVVTDLGNWGRVHALSGNKVYAGGITGCMKGVTTMYDKQPIRISGFVQSFNYGPVKVRSSKDSALVGGIAGYVTAATLQNDYNRGAIRNEGKKGYTGGIAAIADFVTIAYTYNYPDTLSGGSVGALAYELSSQHTVDGFYYDALLDVDAYKKRPTSDTSSYYRNVFAKTFEETVADHEYLKESEWIFGECLPKLKHDTTSTCTEPVVKDFYGDSDKPYVLSFLEDVVLAGDDSTGLGDEGGTTPVLVKPVVPSMQVEVSARNISVTGLVENRPVMLLDMRGRLVATARSHGTAVNLSVPRAGRYIVRSGKQTRIVNVR